MKLVTRKIFSLTINKKYFIIDTQFFKKDIYE